MWNYTEGSTTEGVWEDDYGDAHGTWSAETGNESVRNVIVGESSGKTVGH